MIYALVKELIKKGMTDGLQNKMDVFFAVGRLTEEQYMELTALIGGAENG